MKIIVTLLSFLSLTAHANSSGTPRVTVCRGLVKTPTSSSSPITLEINWIDAREGGRVSSGSQNEQDALVRITVEGSSGIEETIFKMTAGNTRCEEWSQLRGMIVLEDGLYSYYLDFDQSWDHSGCGSRPEGTYLSDTMADGPNHMVKIECR